MTHLTIAVYGDSLSTGTHGDGGYLPALAGLADRVTVHNHAVASSPLAAVAPGSLVDVLADPASLHPEADLVLLWHGTNDWFWGSPLGEPGATDPRCFWGALAHCLGLLADAAPAARLVVPAPLARWERPHGAASAGNAFLTPNVVGATLLDYARALAEGAPAWGYRFVPLPTGFHRGNAALFFEDGVHPNVRGYAVVAPLLVAALRDLLGGS